MFVSVLLSTAKRQIHANCFRVGSGTCAAMLRGLGRRQTSRQREHPRELCLPSLGTRSLNVVNATNWRGVKRSPTQ